MGIVYEAFDEKLERRIALKCAKSGFHKRLPPEVRHASDISHPNVCRIFEIHTANTARGEVEFLTMEFLEGGNAGRASGSWTVVPGAVRSRSLYRFCEGVAAAHRRDVIHGT